MQTTPEEIINFADQEKLPIIFENISKYIFKEI